MRLFHWDLPSDGRNLLAYIPPTRTCPRAHRSRISVWPVPVYKYWRPELPPRAEIKGYRWDAHYNPLLWRSVDVTVDIGRPAKTHMLVPSIWLTLHHLGLLWLEIRTSLPRF